MTQWELEMNEIKRIWEKNGFKLELELICFENGFSGMLKAKVAYRFFDLTVQEKPLIEGNDFSPSPLQAPLSDDSVYNLLGFLTCNEESGVSKDFFKDYSPEALGWVESDRREELTCLVYDFEENSLNNRANKKKKRSKIMSYDIVTADFSKFGYREIKMAQELMEAYTTKKNIPDEFYNEGIQICFNLLSGYVFLSNEEYQVLMMNGDTLEMWHNCSNCGNEGFQEDIAFCDECYQCQECCECTKKE